MTVFFFRARAITTLVLVTSVLMVIFSTSVSADRNEVRTGSGLESSQSSISVGERFSCVATSSGGVKCWGLNDYGQLGNGTTTNSTTPASVSTLTSGVTAISAGESHACALLTDGSVRCWGRNNYGQLGNGTTTNSTTPTSVSTLTSGVTAISAGGFHTCALLTDGSVTCWGRNNYGQLGNGTTTNSTTPTSVSTLTSGVTAISAGQEFTCAVVSEAAKCWGLNSSGQIGDGTTTTRLTPTQSTSLTSGISAITTGGFHTCVITSGGGLKCWGTTSWSTLPTNNGLPIDIAGATSGVVAVAGGSWHTCFITTTGAAKCWGWGNYGALGDGLSSSRTTIGQVTGLTSGVIGIASGGYNSGSEDHSCALLSNNSVSCWGWNTNGQIGDGTTTTRSVPTAVSGLGAGSSGGSTTTTSTSTTTTTTTTTTTLAPTTTTSLPTTTASTSTTNPGTTTTTAAPARVVEIDIQAPTPTVAIGQAAVATIAPRTQSTVVMQPRSSSTTSSTVPTDVPTSVAASKLTPSEVPVIPKLSAGEGAVDIAGTTIKQTLTRKDNQLQIQSGSLSATLSRTNENGVTAPLDKDGNLRLVAGDIMKISLGGFKANSEVTIWFFSTPIKLGTAKVKSDGTVTAVVRLPNGIDDGPHRVAVVAEMTNGKPATFTLGVIVGKFKTTSTLTRILIVIPISLAIGFGFLIPTRLRRRRLRTI